MFPFDDVIMRALQKHVFGERFLSNNALPFATLLTGFLVIQVLTVKMLLEGANNGTNFRM